MDYKIVIDKLLEYGIKDKLEQAIFLAQSDHESNNFTQLSEGEKYRFGRAKLIWPSRLYIINSKQNELNLSDNDICPQPWLFNTVYGNRMGNEINGTNDNDGYNYRGAGIFQLTGKNNYLSFLNWLNKQGKYLNLNINNIRDFVLSEEGAIISAIWYWLSNNIGELARNDQIKKVTEKINGGNIGLKERIDLSNKYKKILGI